MKEVKTQWHPGFVAAVNLELAANRDDLIYEQEYNLNVKPLEIDLLIIKKSRDIQLENEIGKLFLGHNILEYKSPQDHLDIDSFYKAQAYAALYKAYGETVDGRRADDITVTLLREARPLKLLRYLKKHKVCVTAPYQGIYYVLQDVLFPTQIIVTGELKPENHVWLRALTEKMDKQDMKKLLEQVQALGRKLDRELAGAVLNVSTEANQAAIVEMRGDESMEALLRILEPEINQIVEKAVKSAREEAGRAAREEAVASATKMLQSGKFSAEEVTECVPRLSLEEVRLIAEGL